MRHPRITLLLAAALAVTTSPGPGRAAADEPAIAAPAPLATELVNRPLTLPRGMLEIMIPVDYSISSGRVGEPVGLAPGVHYGVTDAVTVGVHHLRGLCLTGQSHGCRDVYEDLGISALARLWRGAGVEIAAGGALNAAPIDPFTLALEARVVARWTGGPVAFSLAPALSIGLDDRDTPAGKTVAMTFPLATYSFGWAQVVTGNREILTVPASIQLQVFPPMAVVVGGALIAPIDPRDGALTDYITVPLGFAVIVTPGTFDIGASVTFANTVGRERWPGTSAGEGRTARLWVAVRM